MRAFGFGISGLVLGLHKGRTVNVFLGVYVFGLLGGFILKNPINPKP